MKLRAFVLPLLILYPLYAGIMFAKQERILFPAASGQHYPLAGALPMQARLIEIAASFGNARAVYQPPVDAAGKAPVILYTHGNFECMQESYALVRPLLDAGIGVLQLEFPGFCGADGDPSFANLIEAENRAYDWLAAQPRIDAARIVSMGYSVGGGPASELTRRRSVRALILLSTYTSVEGLAHRYMLPGFLVRYPFDNAARLRDYAGPVFIEHGTRDPVIPFAMGRELAAVKPHSKFVALDCGHDDCHFDRSLFVQRVPVWLAAEGVLPAKDFEIARQ